MQINIICIQIQNEFVKHFLGTSASIGYEKLLPPHLHLSPRNHLLGNHGFLCRCRMASCKSRPNSRRTPYFHNSFQTKHDPSTQISPSHVFLKFSLFSTSSKGHTNMKRLLMRIFIFFLEIIYWSIMGICYVFDNIAKNPGRTPEERRAIARRARRDLHETMRFHSHMNF